MGELLPAGSAGAATVPASPAMTLQMLSLIFFISRYVHLPANQCVAGVNGTAAFPLSPVSLGLHRLL